MKVLKIIFFILWRWWCSVFFKLIWTLSERFILWWALSASQWQLQHYSQLLCSSPVWLCMRDCSFTQRVLNSHQSAVQLLHGWCPMSCCHLSITYVHTVQPCPSLWCHFIQSHIHKMHVCLAITCHQHFWQNDWDLLCTPAVTQQGWIPK